MQRQLKSAAIEASLRLKPVAPPSLPVLLGYLHSTARIPWLTLTVSESYVSRQDDDTSPLSGMMVFWPQEETVEEVLGL